MTVDASLVRAALERLGNILERETRDIGHADGRHRITGRDEPDAAARKAARHILLAFGASWLR